MGERRPERLSECFIGSLDGVGVHAQRHGRVGMTEATGDRADVVAACDRRRRGPVAQIMQPPRPIRCLRESRARCHHHPMRSGFGGPSIDREHVLTRILPPRRCVSNMSIVARRANTRAGVCCLRWRVDQFGASARSGSAGYGDVLSIADGRLCVKSSHRSAAISERRAPVIAASRKASPAADRANRAESSTTRTSSGVIADLGVTLRGTKPRVPRYVRITQPHRTACASTGAQHTCRPIGSRPRLRRHLPQPEMPALDVGDGEPTDTEIPDANRPRRA